MRLLSLFLLLAPLAAAQQPASPAATDDPTPYSDVALRVELDAAEPGDAFDVALEIVLDEGWHTYWENPGDTGQPVAVDWRVPDGVRVGPLAFPVPEVVETPLPGGGAAGLISYAYHGTVRFPARVALSEGVPETVELVGDVRYLVCADVCLPVRAEVRATVRRGARTPSPDAGAIATARQGIPTDRAPFRLRARDVGAAEDGRRRIEVEVSAFEVSADIDLADEPRLFPLLPAGARRAGEIRQRQSGGVPVWTIPFVSEPTERFRGVLAWEGESRPATLDVLVDGAPTAPMAPTTGLGWALLGAFLGGLLLNLMPCVFPILSIKVLGFVGGDRSSAALRRHGVAFGAGVLVSFWVLAGALLAFRAAGAGLGWGFQLQSPALVAALAGLMVALALNLLGVFEIGARLAGVGGRLDRGQGLGGAFGSGVLAVVVATPCTAPFMGAALGYALAQPPALALAVFTMLGVGMALPYVLLSVFPAWTDRLPRPGPWMVTLRGALAFPLLATAVWLVWVFARQVGPDGAALLLMALVALGLAAWLAGRARTGWGRTAAALAVGAGLGLGGVATRGEAPQAAIADEAWAPYSAEALAALRAEGRPVFVDVTAAWCLTCQVNERTALAAASVREAFEEADVALVKADWTSRDPEITAFLDGFGFAGVPLYVYFPPGGEPRVLPATLTPSIVIDAIREPVAGRTTR